MGLSGKIMGLNSCGRIMGLFNLISFLKPPGLDSGLLALPGLDFCSQVAARGRAGNPKENKPYSQFSCSI